MELTDCKIIICPKILANKGVFCKLQDEKGNLYVTTAYTGFKGSTGPTGPTGPTGEKGEKGPTTSMILANPYPLCKIGEPIPEEQIQYYFNATALGTGTATGIRFMLASNRSDPVRLALYRSNTTWNIATSTLIGMTVLKPALWLSENKVETLTLVAQPSKNLNLTAGEGIILACCIAGATSQWMGSRVSPSIQAWSNTTRLSSISKNFPDTPASKESQISIVPMLELIYESI
jgi:hypothetical protein